MGGQPALGALIRPCLRHFPASAFLRSSVAKRAVHILDADVIGYGFAPDARLAVLLHLLKLFVDAGLKKQLVLVAGGRRPPFKRDRDAPARDGAIATTWHALFACLKALGEADFLVIRAPTECDWRIVEFQRAMQRQDCPAIVYSRDWDYVAHMCPLTASLQRSPDGELVFQTLNLAEAAHKLGLGGLGVTAFPILAALIPGSDWGSPLKGVGDVTALKIVQSLQQRACPPPGSDEQPLLLTPEPIFETALQWEGVELHSSQADKAAALQTFTLALNIFAMVPVVKVGPDFASNKLDISLDFASEVSIGSLRLDDGLSMGLRSEMQRQLAQEFDSVTPMQHDAYVNGEVDPNGCELLECGPPRGDAASLMDYEVEKLVRRGPCVICGAEEPSPKWRADLMDWEAANCSPCYRAILSRLNNGAANTVADAVAEWEADRSRGRAQQWHGQPCSFCEGTIETTWRLPAEVGEYCAAAGVDIGMYCHNCSSGIRRWGSHAHTAAEAQNRKLLDAGAEPLDPEALRLEFSYWKVLGLTRQRGEHLAARRPADAAGASAVG